MPELFRVLRVVVDRPENKTRFLILGSASPELARNASETLAGRVAFIELSGFALHESGSKTYIHYLLIICSTVLIFSVFLVKNTYVKVEAFRV